MGETRVDLLHLLEDLRDAYPGSIEETILTEIVATGWRLVSRHKAEWKWLTPPPGLLVQRGTAVQLRLGNPLSPLLDAGYLEATLRRHYEPLFDPDFDAVLSVQYRHGVAFEVNG